MEPKSVNFLQLALRGAAEGCMVSDLTALCLICQNVGSSSSLKPALSAFCLFQPRFYSRRFPHKHTLANGHQQQTACSAQKDREALKGAPPERLLCPHLFLLLGQSGCVIVYFPAVIFHHPRRVSSHASTHWPGRFLRSTHSASARMLALLSGSPEILWRQI